MSSKYNISLVTGDGIGPDIWRSAVRVIDAAIEKAYNGSRKIHWMEVYAGAKANKIYFVMNVIKWIPWSKPEIDRFVDEWENRP